MITNHKLTRMPVGAFFVRLFSGGLRPPAIDFRSFRGLAAGRFGVEACLFPGACALRPRIRGFTYGPLGL